MERLQTTTMLAPGAKLGPYEIVSLIGEGGMGKVYRAVDTRLSRTVAIKISAEEFSHRFEREARTISALNHPHICTLYDIGSLPSGSAYMVTEFVEGETLRHWLKHSPAMEQRVQIARQILEALRAAHGVGVIHRDLKPANIMVRVDGYAKVLDFGLARRLAMPDVLETEDTATAELSISGQITGTVPYMSPEQILGQDLDQRSDLFAFGIVLFELLTGRHPWPHQSPVDTLHAILHDEPPPQQLALGGVINQLLRKNREERYPSADAVLAALASPPRLQGPSSRALTRLIVLPFRILRQHDASDFLSVSLPDAITNSLTAIDSLVVRSTMTASRFAASEMDLKMISEQAQVDALLTGTILSDGEHLRVTTQLVQAADGKLLWSNTSQATVRNIFQLQDDLVERIVQSLTLPLTAREHRALKHDVPASAIAYECYLRGNQLAIAGDLQSMTLARDLYRRCVDDDAAYAPAWASLGRVFRFLAKYGVDRAGNFAASEDAFQKAFRLNPDLALAHNFYTLLETDLGRPVNAMERLLKRAHSRRNDPNLFAGLVHACRYCGLLEASVAAHDRALRLDPHVQTSVPHTYTLLGASQKALDSCGPTDMWIRPRALEALGRKEEAIEQLRGIANANPWIMFWRILLEEGDSPTSLAALNRAQAAFPVHTSDPEARFFQGCLLAKLNDAERALEFLSGALDEGYHCLFALLHEPDLDPLRSHHHFPELVRRATVLDRHARTVFIGNGGDRLLGVHPDGTVLSAALN